MEYRQLNFNYDNYVQQDPPKQRSTNKHKQTMSQPFSIQQDVPLQMDHMDSYNNLNDYLYDNQIQSPYFNGVQMLQKHFQQQQAAQQQIPQDKHYSSNLKKQNLQALNGHKTTMYDFQQLIEDLSQPSQGPTPRQQDEDEECPLDNNNSLNISSLQILNPLIVSNSYANINQKTYTQKQSTYKMVNESQTNQLCISSMANQLDDLKDQIKNLESKIDHSTLTQTRQSPQSHNSITNSSHRGLVKQKLMSQSIKDEDKMDFNNEQQQQSDRRYKSKNISWGESQIFQEKIQNTRNDQKKNKLRSNEKKGHTNGQSISRGHGKENIAMPTDSSSIGIEDYRWKVEQTKEQNIIVENKQHQASISHQSSSRSILKASKEINSNNNLVNSRYLNNNSSSKLFANNSSYISGQNMNQLETKKSTARDHNHVQQYNSLDQMTLDFEERQMQGTVVGGAQVIVPQTQRDILSIKMKELDYYKDKCKKLSKNCKKLKTEVQDKDQLLTNYKNLNKELKIIKDQWKVSEEIRNDQKKQIKNLQTQLNVKEKENLKLSKKYTRIQNKIREQVNIPFEMPMKVVFEDKTNKRSQQFN